MSKADNLRRLTSDGEFTEEQIQVIERVAEVFNFHTEQIINIINGNLDFTNLRAKLVQFDVTVSSTGVPIAKTSFRADIGSIGAVIISAKNQDNGAIYPSGAPFMTFSPVGTGIYDVKHVTGLQSGQKYRIIARLEYS